LQALDALRVTSAYLWSAGAPVRQALWGQLVLAYVAGLRFGWRMLHVFGPTAGRPAPTWAASRALWFLKEV
jgi:hypothetical protein